MTHIVRFLLLALAGYLASAKLTDAATPREIAESALPSVVSLTVYDSNGIPLSEGSGFFIGADEVVTNFHVMASGTRATAKVTGSHEPLEIAGAVAADRSADLAVLKVSRAVGKPLKLAGVEPGVGDAVYVAGNPEGLAGTFSNGIVSARREVNGAVLIQMTAPISPGSSGSPVMDERGEVVGIAVAVFSEGQNLNFAIPVSRLIALPRSEVPQAVGAAFRQPPNEAVVSNSGRVPERDVTSSDGVLTAYAFALAESELSFTIKSTAADMVFEVHFVAIFYDKAGRVIDSASRVFPSTIPPGLAKRGTVRIPSLAPGLVDRVEVRLIRYATGPEKAYYLVKPGDSGLRISKATGCSLSELEEANPGLDWRRLRVGQAIRVPVKP